MEAHHSRGGDLTWDGSWSWQFTDAYQNMTETDEEEKSEDKFDMCAASSTCYPWPTLSTHASTLGCMCPPRRIDEILETVKDFVIEEENSYPWQSDIGTCAHVAS